MAGSSDRELSDREFLVSEFGREMYAVGRAWRRALSHRAITAGVSDAQWSVIDSLNRSGDGLHQSALADRMGLERTALVRVMRELEAEGIVARRDNPEDGRNKLVFLTDAGREKARAVLDIIRPMEERICQNRTSPELHLMMQLLSDFRTRIAEIEGER